jgi:hypothetical protein
MSSNIGLPQVRHSNYSLILVARRFYGFYFSVDGDSLEISTHKIALSGFATALNLKYNSLTACDTLLTAIK